MNANEMKNVARTATVNALSDFLIANDAVQFADASWAILQEVEGQEIWTEISVKTKAYKPTKVTPAFDPFEVAEIWKEEKKIKEQEKAEKVAEKERKAKKKEEKEA